MTLTKPLYQAIAEYVDSAKTNIQSEYVLEALMKKMPSGSGIDSGTMLLLEESNQNKLVFLVEFHHMNDNGYYCGWSSRKIVITPSLRFNFVLDIEDPDYSGVDCSAIDEETGEEYEDDSFAESIEDYLADIFDYVLNGEVEITKDMFEPTELTWHGELVR